MYRIGQLNRRVDIYRQVKAQDGAGGYVLSAPELWRQCWAYKRDISQKESVKNEQLQADLSAVFVVRNHPAKKIDETMSLIYAGKTYGIQRVGPQEPSEAYVEIIVSAQTEATP